MGMWWWYDFHWEIQLNTEFVEMEQGYWNLGEMLGLANTRTCTWCGRCWGGTNQSSVNSQKYVERGDPYGTSLGGLDPLHVLAPGSEEAYVLNSLTISILFLVNPTPWIWVIWKPGNKEIWKQSSTYIYKSAKDVTSVLETSAIRRKFTDYHVYSNLDRSLLSLFPYLWNNNSTRFGCMPHIISCYAYIYIFCLRILCLPFLLLLLLLLLNSWVELADSDKHWLFVILGLCKSTILFRASITLKRIIVYNLLIETETPNLEWRILLSQTEFVLDIVLDLYQNILWLDPNLL